MQRCLKTPANGVPRHHIEQREGLEPLTAVSLRLVSEGCGRVASSGVWPSETAQGHPWSLDADPAFDEALGEFRAAVGTQLAHIAAAFGLDVEEPLSSILLAPDQDADTPSPRAPRGDHRQITAGAVTSNPRMSLVTHRVCDD